MKAKRANELKLEEDFLKLLEVFHTEASNSFDHSSKATFTMPPYWKGHVARIIEAVPEFNNPQDFYRHATYLLIWCFEQYLFEYPTDSMKAANVIRANEYAQAAARLLAQELKSTEETFAAVRDARDWQTLHELVIVWEERLEGMGETTKEEFSLIVSKARLLLKKAQQSGWEPRVNEAKVSAPVVQLVTTGYSDERYREMFGE